MRFGFGLISGVLAALDACLRALAGCVRRKVEHACAELAFF